MITFQLSVEKGQFSITFFLHSKLNILMKMVDVIEKIFQVCTFKDRINVISKVSPYFWRV